MAFAISTPTSSLLYSSSSSSSTSGGKTSSLCSFSNSKISIPRNAILHHTKSIPQLGFGQWNGLKQIVISTSQYTVKIERRGRCKGKGVYASLFGVGAPEVLVIGVVALLVFGPKGLAEVARNLGQTLRAFQPTIKELQEVSREFKSTLEREIGLDDVNTPVPKRSSSNTKPISEDTPQDSVANVEPNGSSDAEDPDDKYLKVSADRFRGALAQLQKEQEVEKEEKEKELLKSQMQEESESQAPLQDTPQALDVDTQEASSVSPPTENLVNNALQEAGSVAASTGPASKTETQI